jgi:hypothetical protein
VRVARLRGCGRTSLVGALLEARSANTKEQQIVFAEISDPLRICRNSDDITGANIGGTNAADLDSARPRLDNVAFVRPHQVMPYFVVTPAGTRALEIETISSRIGEAARPASAIRLAATNRGRRQVGGSAIKKQALEGPGLIERPNSRGFALFCACLFAAASTLSSRPAGETVCDHPADVLAPGSQLRAFAECRRAGI